jgi:MerR family transcriptional regulator/heat shock protein HspR
MEIIKLNTNPLYTIGIAAKLTGVSVQLLRVYEKEGLILTEKTVTHRRLYSDLEIEKVRCIRRMINEHGMNFAGIRRLLALIPCWKLRKCTPQEKNKCEGYKSSSIPCWATEKKCSHPLPSCRDCIVYQASVDYNDLKALLYDD